MRHRRLGDGEGAGSRSPTRTEVRSPTRTEVRSPTSTSTEVRSPTSTSTDAYTAGNVTVTGGAGEGATNVYIGARPPMRFEAAHHANGRVPEAMMRSVDSPRAAARQLNGAAFGGVSPVGAVITLLAGPAATWGVIALARAVGR